MRWLAANECVLDGTCEPEPITDVVSALADQTDRLPPDVVNDWADPVADVIPLATVVAGILALGWWLLLAALRRPDEGDDEERPASAVRRSPASE